MGRPPSFVSNNRVHNSNVPGVLQNDRYQSVRPRQMAIIIPPVSEELQRLIASEECPLNVQRFQKRRQQWIKESRKLEKAKKRLRDVEETQKEAMEGVRSKCRTEWEEKQSQNEEKLRNELKEQQNDRKRAWKEAIEKEITDQSKQSNSKEEGEELEYDEGKTTDNEVARKEEELRIAREEVAKLNAQKADLIWLMKSVIKAEQKDKAKASETSDSKISASKQA